MPVSLQPPTDLLPDSAVYKRDFSRTVSIEFIGVFDTVSAVGALIPRTLPFSTDNHITRTFRHAIALDENRAAFIPQPWERTIDPPERAPEPENQPEQQIRRNGLGRKHVGIVRTAVAQVAKAVKKRLVVSAPDSDEIRGAAVPPSQSGPSTDVKVCSSGAISFTFVALLGLGLIFDDGS